MEQFSIYTLSRIASFQYPSQNTHNSFSFIKPLSLPIFKQPRSRRRRRRRRRRRVVLRASKEMGSLVGHVLPGFGFFVIGLWHLLNHIKLHTLNPKNYTAVPWFPTSKSRYLELFVIMGGSLASISMELFIGPARHQPLDPDGTIPSTHLHNFEHALISATLFLYAAFAIILDKISPKAKAQYGLTVLLGASAFGQELLLFRLHSTDHHGVEGQYHFLLQVVIFVSLTTTLLAINYPRSFMMSFVRSLSILFQGVWLAVMGVMLWTPDFVPKGCFLNFEDGHEIVQCHSDAALNRAKSLVNIEFAWYVILLSVFAVCFYLFLIKIYGNKVEFRSISKSAEQEEEEFDDDDDDDVEAQKKSNLMETKRLVPMGKSFIAMKLER